MRGRSHVLWSFAVISICLASSAQAFAGWRCPSETPEIHLETVQSETKVIRTKSIETLNKMHGSPLADNTMVSGYGGGEIGLGGTPHFVITTRENESCIHLSKIEARFYAYPVIHIARNYPEGTCEYNAVMEHELKHIQTLKDFHKEYSGIFETELRLTARRIFPRGPMPISQIKNAQDQMVKRIEAYIHSFNDRILPILEKRQAAIDSAEEYAAVQAKCDAWHRYR